MACDSVRLLKAVELLIVAAVVLLTSGSAASATSVGTPLPTGLSSSNPGPTPWVQNVVQTRLDASSIANGATLEFPGGGWVTAFRVEITQLNTPQTIKFKILRPLSTNQFTVVGVTQPLTPEAGIKEYGGYCLPVQQGDQIGITTKMGIDATLPMVSTGLDQISVDTTLGDVGVGETLTVNPMGFSPYLLPINAEFKTNAEGCVSPPADDPTPLAGDVTPPTISNLASSEKCVAFKGNNRSGKAAINSKKKRSCAKQSKITYELSEDATIKATTAVRRDGLKKKKSGAACKKASSKRLTQVRRSRSLKKKYRVCRLFVELGSVESQDKSGTNEYIFTGRFAGKKLKPGTYRIGFVATDSAGNASSGVSTNVLVK